jgi:hypothetical protein
MVHSLLPLEAKAASAAAQLTDGRSIEETEAEAAAVAAAAVAAAAAAAAEAEEALAPLADWTGGADSLPPPVAAPPAAAAAEGGSPTQGPEGAAANPAEPAATALNGTGHLLNQQQHPQQQQQLQQQRVSQRQQQRQHAPTRTSMSPPAGGAAAPQPPLPPPAPAMAMAPPKPPRRQGPPPGGIVGEALAALAEAFPDQQPLLLPPIEGGSDERTFMSAYAGFWSVRGTGQPHCLTANFRVLPYRLWQEVHAWGGPALLSGQNVSGGGVVGLFVCVFLGATCGCTGGTGGAFRCTVRGLCGWLNTILVACFVLLCHLLACSCGGLVLL